MRRIISNVFSKLEEIAKNVLGLIKNILSKVFTEKLIVDSIQTIIKTIIITIITTVFLFFANNIFKTYKEIKNTNEIIDKLCLGESKEYIEHILGIPRFEFRDKNISNYFYSLDMVVLRFVFDEESLVGYFITVKTANSGVEIKDPIMKNEIIKFGEQTFAQCGHSDSLNTVIDGCYGSGGGAAINTYYWEYGYMFGVGLYKDYVTAIFPYGFTEKDSVELMSMACGESIESDIITNYRGELHPNTIGIMDSHYEDIIKPYMYNDENYILWLECMMKLIEDVNDF